MNEFKKSKLVNFRKCSDSYNFTRLINSKTGYHLPDMLFFQTIILVRIEQLEALVVAEPTATGLTWSEAQRITQNRA